MFVMTKKVGTRGKIMKGINLVLYSIKQGMINLKRNQMFTWASVGTVAACLFLFGFFYFVISNFENIVQTAESSVGISVFFDETASQQQIENIGKVIQGYKEVDRIQYVSAEEAWERFKKDNFSNEKELVESFGEDNPLAESASYEIYLKDIRQQELLVARLEQIEGIRKVKKSDEVAGGMANVSNVVGVISLVLILILLLVSVFLIHTTIATGIHVRKQEIAIMRLMGASDALIWAPFMVEGVVIGLLGAMLPLGLLFLSYGRMISYVSQHFALFSKGLSFLTTQQIFAILVPVSLFVGVGIGFIGSFITVRRNMNV